MGDAAGNPYEEECVPMDVAPLLPLSGYDVGEVPFVMQAVCYYRETLDVGRAGLANIARHVIGCRFTRKPRVQVRWMT